MARSAGGWLRSLSPSANPRPSGIPLPWEGGRWATHPPSPPFHGKGVDGLLIPLLPPSSGRRWRVAPEVGFALFRLRPTPALPRERGDGLLIPLLPPFSGRRWRIARRRLALLSFDFGQPPALRASPFHGKGVDGLLIPLLPPSSGRRWRVAPEVGFALFRLRPTPALRASPFHGKGVDGLLAHSSTLHYPFTENGFQILATFIELKMNLKIGQSHYF